MCRFDGDRKSPPAKAHLRLWAQSIEDRPKWGHLSGGLGQGRRTHSAGTVLRHDTASRRHATKRQSRCNSPSRHRRGACRLRMGRLVANGSDASGAASPGCRRNVAVSLAEKFCRARVARVGSSKPDEIHCCVFQRWFFRTSCFKFQRHSTISPVAGKTPMRRKGLIRLSGNPASAASANIRRGGRAHGIDDFAPADGFAANPRRDGIPVDERKRRAVVVHGDPRSTAGFRRRDYGATVHLLPFRREDRWGASAFRRGSSRGNSPFVAR